MKRLICLILIVMMACSAIWCGNSIFSFGGMPVRYYGNDIYGLSMGDTGLADNFRYNSGFGNPALHNASNRTLLATGMVFGFTRYASEGGKSFVDDALDLPYLSLSVPVKKTQTGPADQLAFLGPGEQCRKIPQRRQHQHHGKARHGQVSLPGRLHL